MHIVIVGAGFAGVKTALELQKNKAFKITLISDKDHFVYYPALYSMATGASHQQAIVKLDKIFRNTNVTVVQDTITQYDPKRHIVAGKKSYHYDKVVIALGVVTSYFGIPGLDKYSFSIKSDAEVKRFKQHLHDELTQDKHLDKHYVIVGAGATGVELSAALTSYLDNIADYHKVRHSKISIKLVEAAPRVLPRMSEGASIAVKNRLKSLGVQVLTNEKVEAQDDDSIIISGKDVPTKTVVWTSGVSNHPFFAQHSSLFRLSPNGRVIVDSYMMSDHSTYVIGDNAFTPFSGLAQTALHDALFTARDIIAVHNETTRRLYKPVKPPVVIPVGHNWAILEWKNIVLTGWIASLIRRAADFIGYRDILPLGQALGVWRTEWVREETCEVCAKNA